MNILIVYAHPEPRSLNGALKDLALRHLTARGQEVRVSDLYAMDWKAIADGEDFLAPDSGERLFYERASKAAFANGSQSADIATEQDKLLWADAVILQFPLWWFSMPAILKGWVDRVFALGFAYGVGEHGGERWGDRYGEGTLTGRRAMLSVTIGGRAPHYSDRGVNGALDDLLFPIHHGVLFYPGMDVLPPFVAYQADHLKDEQWPSVEDAFKARLDGLFTDEVIPFRRQNSGHYDGQQVLKPGLGDGASGTRIHLVQRGDPEQRPVPAPSRPGR
ncbi:NAD(P)H-dependent oxidoreductase [Corallococcus carmarthensis]|uniref:NAD(P)H-dependent oxidoreductase n=1 Tax=Corallococcus carmarthensis TaxID=2316728 RepID=UPI00148B4753|nr:NAD(P)H-dependent oxidoreductase [Corallococcus carmarthensis]NOK21857.1 NAD(P)H-dependent oxidoreductase [Corallococcus carmarthensis]